MLGYCYDGSIQVGLVRFQRARATIEATSSNRCLLATITVDCKQRGVVNGGVEEEVEASIASAEGAERPRARKFVYRKMLERQ